MKNILSRNKYKKREKKEDFEREKKELEKYKPKKEEDFSILDEIKKLKKRDLVNYLSTKKRKTEPSKDSASENEAEEVKLEKKKRKRSKAC